MLVCFIFISLPCYLVIRNKDTYIYKLASKIGFHIKYVSVTIVFIQLNMYNNLILLTNWQYYKGYRVREFKLIQSKSILLLQLSRLWVYIKYKLWKEGLTLNTNKGNNKSTELRTIFQRESQNYKVYKQTQSVNSRKTVETVMTVTSYIHFQKMVVWIRF